MVSITLSVSEEIKKEMDKFPEINWSEIAREAIKRRIVILEKFRKFTENSEFTEEDSIRLGKELNRKLRRRRK